MQEKIFAFEWTLMFEPVLVTVRCREFFLPTFFSEPLVLLFAHFKRLGQNRLILVPHGVMFSDVMRLS